MEDVGTGQIQAGYAFVKVDPAFAGAINMAAGYHVLITPEGDSRGLYVGQRSAQGFSVREI